MITLPPQNMIPILLAELSQAKATITRLQANQIRDAGTTTAQDMAHQARMIVCNEINARQDGEMSELIGQLVVQYGGTLVSPSTSNWHSHEFEITLLGCSSRGNTIQAAAKQWAKAANRMAQEH